MNCSVEEIFENESSLQWVHNTFCHFNALNVLFLLGQKTNMTDQRFVEFLPKNPG